MKSRYIILALAFVALILAAGCTTTQTAQTNTGNDSKVLIIGEMWEPDSIDPAGHNSGTLICEKALITETLVGANADFKSQARPCNLLETDRPAHLGIYPPA